MAIMGILIGVTAVSLVMMDFIMNHFLDQEPDFNRIEAGQLYDQASGTLKRQLPDRYGGWLELVDEWGNVAAACGKQDDILSYAEDDLYARMDTFRKGDSIHYHVYSVAGPNGEHYKLLWKIPEPLSSILLALSIFAGSALVLLSVALYFYTMRSVRQLKKPLQQIVGGIKEMERFNYATRLEFYAEKELAEIRDAFNGMAERIQSASLYKEKAERNRQNLLLHLSHDLKTPITSILGYSQLLLEQREPGESQNKRYVRYIHDKSSYMSQLVHDLFELAKLDDPHLKLELERINMTKWFQQTIAERYPDIEQQGFELQVDLEETPLYVRMDRMQMNRVVDNLIGNALKYNPSGTTLYAACREEEGRVLLWIGDDGIGLPVQDREVLFDEFVRGTAPLKDGTGLGLAICRKIITRHEGTIELLDEPPYSTLFRIGLPKAPGASA